MTPPPYSPAHADRAGRVLRLSVLAAAALPVVPAFAAGASLPVTVRLEALALWAACLVPAWAYGATPPARRAPIPFMPLLGVVYGAYFSLPLALGLTGLGGFGSYLRPEDYAAAVDAAFLGWLGLLAGVSVTNALLRDRPAAPELLRMDVLLRWAKTFAVGGTLLDLLPSIVTIPTVVASLATFALTVGRFGLALGVLLIARGCGRPADALLLAGCTAVTTVVIFSSGILSGSLFLAATVGFGLWAGRGILQRREVAAAFAVVVFVVVLRAVIPDFREEAWHSGKSLSLPARITLMASLVVEGADSEDGLLSAGAEQVGERSAAADMLADVIQRTPAEVPYWEGETYVSLVGAFVPRLLWPDKPEKNLAQRFGHRYAYLGVSDTGTAINLPWLVEFYANFGMGFVPVGGVIVGFIVGMLGSLVNRPGQGAVVTALGIALLVPLYSIETDFSLNFGGLILYGIAMSVVLRFLRHVARVGEGQPSGRAVVVVAGRRPGLT